MRAALLCVALTACGYRFTAPNASLPEDIRSVRVPMFDNRTADATAEQVFTQTAKDQLQRAGLLAGEGAEATLLGSVISITSAPFMTAATLPRQPGYRVTVTLSLKLMKGERVVSSATVTAQEEFPSGADVLLTESNREAAVRRIAETTVRQGLERLQAP